MGNSQAGLYYVDTAKLVDTNARRRSSSSSSGSRRTRTYQDYDSSDCEELIRRYAGPPPRARFANSETMLFGGGGLRTGGGGGIHYNPCYDSAFPNNNYDMLAFSTALNNSSRIGPPGTNGNYIGAANDGAQMSAGPGGTNNNGPTESGTRFTSPGSTPRNITDSNEEPRREVPFAAVRPTPSQSPSSNAPAADEPVKPFNKFGMQPTPQDQLHMQAHTESDYDPKGSQVNSPANYAPSQESTKPVTDLDSKENQNRIPNANIPPRDNGPAGQNGQTTNGQVEPQPRNGSQSAYTAPVQGQEPRDAAQVAPVPRAPTNSVSPYDSGPVQSDQGRSLDGKPGQGQPTLAAVSPVPRQNPVFDQRPPAPSQSQQPVSEETPIRNTSSGGFIPSTTGQPEPNATGGPAGSTSPMTQPQQATVENQQPGDQRPQPAPAPASGAPFPQDMRNNSQNSGVPEPGAVGRPNSQTGETNSVPTSVVRPSQAVNQNAPAPVLSQPEQPRGSLLRDSTVFGQGPVPEGTGLPPRGPPATQSKNENPPKYNNINPTVQPPGLGPSERVSDPAEFMKEQPQELREDLRGSATPAAGPPHDNQPEGSAGQNGQPTNGDGQVEPQPRNGSQPAYTAPVQGQEPRNADTLQAQVAPVPRAPTNSVSPYDSGPVQSDQGRGLDGKPGQGQPTPAAVSPVPRQNPAFDQRPPAPSQSQQPVSEETPFRNTSSGGSIPSTTGQPEPNATGGPAGSTSPVTQPQQATVENQQPGDQRPQPAPALASGAPFPQDMRNNLQNSGVPESGAVGMLNSQTGETNLVPTSVVRPSQAVDQSAPAPVLSQPEQPRGSLLQDSTVFGPVPEGTGLSPRGLPATESKNENPPKYNNINPTVEPPGLGPSEQVSEPAELMKEKPQELREDLGGSATPAAGPQNTIPSAQDITADNNGGQPRPNVPVATVHPMQAQPPSTDAAPEEEPLKPLKFGVEPIPQDSPAVGPSLPSQPQEQRGSIPKDLPANGPSLLPSRPQEQRGSIPKDLPAVGPSLLPTQPQEQRRSIPTDSPTLGQIHGPDDRGLPPKGPPDDGTAKQKPQIKKSSTSTYEKQPPTIEFSERMSEPADLLRDRPTTSTTTTTQNRGSAGPTPVPTGGAAPEGGIEPVRKTSKSLHTRSLSTLDFLKQYNEASVEFDKKQKKKSSTDKKGGVGPVGRKLSASRKGSAGPSRKPSLKKFGVGEDLVRIRSQSKVSLHKSSSDRLRPAPTPKSGSGASRKPSSEKIKLSLPPQSQTKTKPTKRESGSASPNRNRPSLTPYGTPGRPLKNGKVIPTSLTKPPNLPPTRKPNEQVFTFDAKGNLIRNDKIIVPGWKVPKAQRIIGTANNTCKPGPNVNRTKTSPSPTKKRSATCLKVVPKNSASATNIGRQNVCRPKPSSSSSGTNIRAKVQLKPKSGPAGGKGQSKSNDKFCVQKVPARKVFNNGRCSSTSSSNSRKLPPSVHSLSAKFRNATSFFSKKPASCLFRVKPILKKCGSVSGLGRKRSITFNLPSQSPSALCVNTAHTSSRKPASSPLCKGSTPTTSVSPKTGRRKYAKKKVAAADTCAKDNWVNNLGPADERLSPSPLHAQGRAGVGVCSLEQYRLHDAHSPFAPYHDEPNPQESSTPEPRVILPPEVAATLSQPEAFCQLRSQLDSYLAAYAAGLRESSEEEQQQCPLQPTCYAPHLHRHASGSELAQDTSGMGSFHSRPVESAASSVCVMPIKRSFSDLQNLCGSNETSPFCETRSRSPCSQMSPSPSTVQCPVQSRSDQCPVQPQCPLQQPSQSQQGPGGRCGIYLMDSMSKETVGNADINTDTNVREENLMDSAMTQYKAQATLDLLLGNVPRECEPESTKLEPDVIIPSEPEETVPENLDEVQTQVQESDASVGVSAMTEEERARDAFDFNDLIQRGVIDFFINIMNLAPMNPGTNALPARLSARIEDFQQSVHAREQASGPVPILLNVSNAPTEQNDGGTNGQVSNGDDDDADPDDSDHDITAGPPKRKHLRNVREHKMAKRQRRLEQKERERAWAVAAAAATAAAGNGTSPFAFGGSTRAPLTPAQITEHQRSHRRRSLLSDEFKANLEREVYNEMTPEEKATLHVREDFRVKFETEIPPLISVLKKSTSRVNTQDEEMHEQDEDEVDNEGIGLARRKTSRVRFSSKHEMRRYYYLDTSPNLDPEPAVEVDDDDIVDDYDTSPALPHPPYFHNNSDLRTEEADTDPLVGVSLSSSETDLINEPNPMTNYYYRALYGNTSTNRPQTRGSQGTALDSYLNPVLNGHLEPTGLLRRPSSSDHSLHTSPSLSRTPSGSSFHDFSQQQQ